MRWKKISDAVVRRLPLYLRVLEDVSRDEDRKLMSSQELGERAGVSPALVRKDLAWFGEFGKQGVGYEISYLRDELRRILNLNEKIRVALVGVGSLGQALTRYNKSRLQQDRSFNIEIVALFDNDPSKFGKSVEGLTINPFSQLEEKIKALGVRMAIITVPVDQAQGVVDSVVAAGIRAILNFAPTKLIVPEGVRVASADLSLELQRLAYYLDD